MGNGALPHGPSYRAHPRLYRPGGNITGFMNIEYGLGGKWLELLKQIAPHVTRVAVIRSQGVEGTSQFAAIQAVAPLSGIEVTPISVRSDAEIEHAVSDYARAPNGGLIVVFGTAAATSSRNLVVTLAARHRLPAVYFARNFVINGGLISYGPDVFDIYRRSATYVDRILKGERPSDLPVQAPTKYETVLNMKTAKALGLVVPPSILLRADEVIE
jgi:putative ABC transport system substrate-binding protein